MMRLAVLAIAASITAVLAGSILKADDTAPTTPAKPAALNFTMKDIDGKLVDLSQYAGKVLLIVNVASKCGNTPQYAGLEAMYAKYKDKGFAILGFPANNFGAQEPGTDAQIKVFCTGKYDVTFPMFSKVSVKGDDITPLYKYLTSVDTKPAAKGDITWNFEKFIIARGRPRLPPASPPKPNPKPPMWSPPSRAPWRSNDRGEVRLRNVHCAVTHACILSPSRVHDPTSRRKRHDDHRQPGGDAPRRRRPLFSPSRAGA